jgi:hypothetical protein
MRTAKMATVVGVSAVMLSALAASAAAQQRVSQRAPIIRVYSENGSDVLGTTTYITPAIQVSDDAYVFAVSMDLDGQIQVLHPEFPGLSVRIAAHRQLRLPNFFTGYAQQSQYGGIFSSINDPRYRNGYLDSRGTIIALASRAPFNLERIEVGGNWDLSALRSLIEDRSPQDAAQALASYLGARGEPIGRDYMRFAGGRTYDYAYGGYPYGYYGYDPCPVYYGYGFGPLHQAQLFRYMGLLRQRGQQVRVVGYDLCGFPIVAPVTSTVTGHFPAPRPPRNPGDTTVFPKSRIPMGGIPRYPGDPNVAPGNVTPENAPAEGAFTSRQRPGVPQPSDGTTGAQSGRREKPQPIFEEYRGQPRVIPAPRETPAERPMPRREPATGTGSQPPREYRPPPRVEPTQPVHEYRPPPRVEPPPPERPRESPPPAPVIRERPVERPAPPPPRAETPTTRAEPARVVPPPKQQQ